MSRLTKKDYKDWVYLTGTTLNEKASNHLNEINHKLGQLEDLMEQYSINDLTELKMALDYYEQTKKVEKITANAEIDTFKEIQDLLTKTNIYDKLSNELGYPLEVVFKALKEGIYFNFNMVLNEKFIETTNLSLKFSLGGFYCLYFEQWCVSYEIDLKDYGKTWWLKGDKQ